MAERRREDQGPQPEQPERPARRAARQRPADGMPAAPGTTGRYLVLLRQDAVRQGTQALTRATGLEVASAADFADGAVNAETLEGADAIVFDRLGVAVVNAPPEQFRALGMAAEDSAILAVEPERYVQALEASQDDNGLHVGADMPASPYPTPANLPLASSGMPLDYFIGYRDAVNQLVDRLLAVSGAPAEAAEARAAALDERQLTWGLQLTRAGASQFSGRGVRVAILDTGLDLGHPDFVGRHIVSHSFIQGQTAQDGHGHGTHTAGTACGARQPQQLPRYGIAYESDIYIGKVLNNQGSGTDSGILAGIQWAITNGCAAVSMSLGQSGCQIPPVSQVFEQVAQRAFAAGTWIIAAAGNDSQRPGHICPVSHPANCPSITAVGALDQSLSVAFFSNGGLAAQGGQVDIAAPGVNVRSSWPRPRLYNTIGGTSMATPHVSGIAALFAQAQPGLRGRALAHFVLTHARHLTLPARDVGSGLVQAP